MKGNSGYVLIDNNGRVVVSDEIYEALQEYESHSSTPSQDGDWNSVNWEEVLTKCVPAGTKFYFVPDYLANLWKKECGDNIELIEDRDSWDYMWDNEKMVNKEGSEYKELRNMVKRFEKDYTPEIEEITLENLDRVKVIAKRETDKIMEKTNAKEELAEEYESFLETINNYDKLNLKGIIIKVDGNDIAFSISEVIDANNAIGLYQKQDLSYTGITQYIYSTITEYMRNNGVLTYNIMCDEGSTGLRAAKLKTNPMVLMKKYIVIWKGENKKVETDSSTLKLIGRIDSVVADEWEEKINKALPMEGDFTLDCSELSYISSAGIRVLLATYKVLKATGGKLKMINVSQDVKDILSMTGLSSMFEVEGEDDKKEIEE